MIAASTLTGGDARAQVVGPTSPGVYARAVAAGYKAALYCSGMFNAGRTAAQIDADELRGIYPDYEAIVPTLEAKVDRAAPSVSVAFDATGALPPRVANWLPGAGCVLNPIGDGHIRPPTHHERAPGPLPADARAWPQGDGGIAPRPSPALSAVVARAFDGATYGKSPKTVGVVVVRDGRIVAERYADGFGPFVSNRTWSVGKSIAGTLIGIAAQGGGVDRDRPAEIVQWNSPLDPRRAITLDMLLRMGSGLHSDTAGNRTDAIYFGGTAVDEQAPAWPLEARPGTRFRYANNDILLAIYAVRHAIGEARYRRLPSDLFGPLGMAHTVAEQDWHGNYVLSSQVWSTARDFARLGLFWMADGVWAGKRLLPEGWVRYMTTPSGPQPANGPGYGATMWLFGPDQGLPAGSYAAQGNRGQYIMVVPAQRLIVVRRGEDPGNARFDIARFTADIASTAP